MAAAESAIEHFSVALKRPAGEVDVDGIVTDCLSGRNLGLFQRGGVQEDDFIALRALAEVLRPTFYVESGVFRGSSLYALHSCACVDKIWAIDPNLDSLLFRDDVRGRTTYESERDFGEVDFGRVPSRSLVYFDDHIDSARRINEAFRHGFRALAFDDSTGFYGIGQRLFPAVPSVGMIKHMGSLRAGDVLVWRVANRRWLSAPWLGKWFPKAVGAWELRFEITETVVAQMKEAAAVIERILTFPDLREYLATRDNRASFDKTKYLVLLKDERVGEAEE